VLKKKGGQQCDVVFFYGAIATKKAMAASYRGLLFYV